MTRTPAIPLAPLVALALASFGPALTAQEPRRVEPGTSRGGPFAWAAKDGLEYVYHVPKRYDPRAGANVTFILHGSNLTRRWGFANHRAGVFRPDDIVVCPDGTTSNGSGGFNFLGKPEDLARLHALHEELRAAFKVRATFLYGHSQGSFFAFHYAGAYPADVQGVVGHASGVWTWTAQPKEAHHQAIVLLHGTQDPVVPYLQSGGGLRSFREAGYPTARWRSLEGWNHWPAEHNGPTPHASQQLAWCEGMTTDDPARLAASFATLTTVKEREWHDWAATYAVAKRIAEHEEAPKALARRAAAVVAKVEALTKEHVAALERASKDNAEGRFDGKPWSGHLRVFLRAFAGTPDGDALAEKWSAVLERHREDAVKHLRAHYESVKAGDDAKAFAEGVAALKQGFLHVECEDRRFLEWLEEARKKAEARGIDAAATREFDAVIPAFRDTLEKGRREFEAINRKRGAL